MILPFKISNPNVHVSIPTGFDVEWNWSDQNIISIKDQDNKKINISDSGLMYETIFFCKKYWKNFKGFQIDYHSFGLKHIEHIISCYIIKQTCILNGYSEEWLYTAYDKIYEKHDYGIDIAYLLAFVQEQEGLYFTNQDQKMVYHPFLKGHGKSIFKAPIKFSLTNTINNNEIESMIDNSQISKLISTFHYSPKNTNIEKLNKFVLDIYTDEMTILTNPATDGFNQIIIVYYYIQKSKKMQDILTNKLTSHFNTEIQFLG